MWNNAIGVHFGMSLCVKGTSKYSHQSRDRKVAVLKIQHRNLPVVTLKGIFRGSLLVLMRFKFGKGIIMSYWVTIFVWFGRI